MPLQAKTAPWLWVAFKWPFANVPATISAEILGPAMQPTEERTKGEGDVAPLRLEWSKQCPSSLKELYLARANEQ